jgi:hypothetical protein
VIYYYPEDQVLVTSAQGQVFRSIDMTNEVGDVFTFNWQCEAVEILECPRYIDLSPDGLDLFSIQDTLFLKVVLVEKTNEIEEYGFVLKLYEGLIAYTDSIVYESELFLP